MSSPSMLSNHIYPNLRRDRDFRGFRQFCGGELLKTQRLPTAMQTGGLQQPRRRIRTKRHLEPSIRVREHAGRECEKDSYR